MSKICAGFSGILKVNEKFIRCNSINLTIEQSPIFYNHIYGLIDKVITDNNVKGEVQGEIRPQRNIWRPGALSYRLSVQYPITKNNFIDLFRAAKQGEWLTNINVITTQNNPSAILTYAKIANYSLTITAGDIITCSLDIEAIGISDKNESGESEATTGLYSDTEKLMTWDNITITADDIDYPIKSLTLNIKNNIIPIRTAKFNFDRKMAPATLRIGLQEVNGSIAYYTPGPPVIVLDDDTVDKNIMIDILNTHTININSIYKPINREGAIGPAIITLPFEGTGLSLGEYES